jgi:glycosyltransferase involved in cell wall biosynthesis
MKILVASHSYIVDLNCEKLRQLAQINDEIQVTVVVPKKWNPKGVQSQIIETQFKAEGNFRVVPVSNFSQNHQGLLTFGTDVIPLLKEFKPNIIQVEQGVKSLAYAEFISLNNWLNLDAKNCFFSWWNLPYKMKFPFSWLEQFNLRYTDGFIAGNQDAVDIITEHGYQGPITVMPNLGVDEQLFSPQAEPELAAELGIKPDDFVIGFVGRFVVEKGILTLIKALKKLSNYAWKLLLLGRGELTEEIIQEMKEMGLEKNLILIPSVPHTQVPRYINLMNTLVLPSETTFEFKTISAVGWKEQFGHVLIEAMACKVPVIGSDSGEIPNVIADAGLIFPEKNDLALSNCLERLMAEPELTRELAEKGYERVMANYTNRALAEKLLDFYYSL